MSLLNQSWTCSSRRLVIIPMVSTLCLFVTLGVYFGELHLCPLFQGSTKFLVFLWPTTNMGLFSDPVFKIFLSGP